MAQVFTNGVACDPGLVDDPAYGKALLGQVTNSVHGLTPEHRHVWSGYVPTRICPFRGGSKFVGNPGQIYIGTNTFRPSALPPKDLDWSALVSHVGQAHAAVARYDGRLEAIPNPRVFLSPLLTQEAVLSSKIEGTQATLEEVLEFEA